MSIPFKSAPFKTSIGTTARTLDQRYSDIINVHEFENLKEGGSGTIGDGTGNDAPCIQAAFDAAFGSSSAPHGLDNCHLNRPVQFPAGDYRITENLNLTRVVGGSICGAGNGATTIRLEASGDPGGLWPLLDINGAANLRMENMKLTHKGLGGTWTGLNSCCINLDWDGTNGTTGSDGLHGNIFQNMNIGGGNHVVIIGESDNEGHNNLFIGCTVAGGSTGDAHGNIAGYDVRGSAALNNLSIGGGGNAEVVWMRCPSGGGSMSAYAASIASYSGSDANFVMESGHIMTISGGRTENFAVLRMTNGIVNVNGFAGTDGTTDWAEVNGGICNIIGCGLGANGQITGTGGELNISGSDVRATTPLSGYSGTVKWNPQGLT